MKGHANGRLLARVGAAVLAAWLVVNGATSYAATNLWLTELFWRTPDRDGEFAAAIRGTAVRTSDVVGYHVPPGSRGGTVIVVHGYNGSLDSPANIEIGRWLRDSGFGVLAINLGYLDGRHRYSAGRREAGDIRAAIDWLDRRDERLAGVWAFSAGAHAALIAAATDRRIPWLISDGGFASGEAQLRRTASANLKVLPPAGFPLMAVMVRAFSGDHPVDLLAQHWPGTPVLIVHGDADHVVPLGVAHSIRAHTGGELLLLRGVEHTQAYRMEPVKYQAASMAFIERASAGTAEEQASRSTSSLDR